MDFFLTEDIKVGQLVLIKNYNFMKLTEDNLFGCYYGDKTYFSKEGTIFENDKFRKYGCNIWKDCALRRSISKGGTVYDKVITEELAWNLEEVTVETASGKQKTETTDVFFVPCAADMNEEWVKIAESLLPRWRPSNFGSGMGRGNTDGKLEQR